MNAEWRRRVLCVDDDLGVLSLLAASLRHFGYDVETAVDGRDALHKMAGEEQPFDLLITDACMPLVDGHTLIVQARAAGYSGKVIVFSASMEGEECERYRALPVDGIVKKPAAPGELRELVRRIAGPPVEANRAG